METQTIAYDEKKEVINLEEDSSENSEDEYDNEDEDPVRADIYEDYDELADLAVTASEEPPPPGTRPLQEELMTLITENTVSGVTINKDEVVAWLRNEEAALTGEIIPNRVFPSPPSSSDKLSDNETSDRSRSERSPPKKKSKSVSSVAVKRDGDGNKSHSRRREGSHQKTDGSRHERDGAHHKKDRSHHHSRPNRSGSRSQDGPRLRRENNRRGNRSQDQLDRGELRHFNRGMPYRNHHQFHRDVSPLANRSNSSFRRERYLSPDRRPVNKRRQTAVRPKRQRSNSPVLRHNDRRVKLQRKVEDEKTNSSKHYHKEISSQIQKPARSQNVNGVRDARELLSEKRTHETHVPVTEYVKSLKEQIRSSEINARKIFKELQSTKKDLMTYLKESGDSGGDNYRLKECSRDNRERRSEKKRLDDQPPHKSRESSKNRQKSPERKRSRTHGKSTSPGCESRRSSSSPDRGSEHPDHWNILSPSQVDGFNCGGPAIFVQNFTKDVSRKDLYSYFKHFGTVMDLKKLYIGKRRSACVIYSRQSEADKVLQISSGPSSRCSPQLDMMTPPSTFDRLLSALQNGQPPDDDDDDDVVIL